METSTLLNKHFLLVYGYVRQMCAKNVCALYVGSYICRYSSRGHDISHHSFSRNDSPKLNSHSCKEVFTARNMKTHLVLTPGGVMLNPALI